MYNISRATCVDPFLMTCLNSHSLSISSKKLNGVFLWNNVRQLIIHWNGPDEGEDEGEDDIEDPKIEIGDRNSPNFSQLSAPVLQRHQLAGIEYHKITSILIYEDASKSTTDLVVKLGQQLKNLVLQSVRLSPAAAEAISAALNPNLLESLDIVSKKFIGYPRRIDAALAARGEWPGLRHLSTQEFRLTMLHAPNLESLTVSKIDWGSTDLPHIAERFPKLRILDSLSTPPAAVKFATGVPFYSQLESFTKQFTGFPSRVLRFAGVLLWSHFVLRLNAASQGVIDSATDVVGSDSSFLALARALIDRCSLERLETFHEKQLEILLGKFVDSTQDLICPQAYLAIFRLSCALIRAGNKIRGKFWQEKFVELLPRSSTSEYGIADLIFSHTLRGNPSRGLKLWGLWVRQLEGCPIPLEASVVPELERRMRFRNPANTKGNVELLSRLIDSDYFPEPIPHPQKESYLGFGRGNSVLLVLSYCPGGAAGSYGHLLKLAKFATHHNLASPHLSTSVDLFSLCEAQQMTVSTEEEEFCRLYAALFAKSIDFGLLPSKILGIFEAGNTIRLFDILHAWYNKWRLTPDNMKMSAITSAILTAVGRAEAELSPTVTVLVAEFILAVSPRLLFMVLSSHKGLTEQDPAGRLKSLLAMLDEVAPSLNWPTERRAALETRCRSVFQPLL